MHLNSEQAKGLSRFFFDVAKGLVLGGVGLAATAPVRIRLLAALAVAIIATFCVRFALWLLEEVK